MFVDVGNDGEYASFTYLVLGQTIEKIVGLSEATVVKCQRERN